MARTLRPLAVGVVKLPAGVTKTQRRDIFLRVALAINEEGYALGELFELGQHGIGEDAMYQALGEVAQRVDARAVVAYGAVDQAAVSGVAGALQMMVLNIE